jgi:hypothetical protein
MPKGEKVLSPKQKDRTTILKFNVYFKLVSRFFNKGVFISIGISFGFKISISVEISIGVISFGIYFKKGKSFQKPS